MESINSDLKLGAVGQQESNGLAGEQCTSAKRSRQNTVHFQPHAEIGPKMKSDETKKRNIWDFFL